MGYKKAAFAGLGLGILVTMLGWWFFRGSSSNIATDIKPIAFVEVKLNEVQRKKDSELNWNKIQLQDSIFNNDTILTSENSSTQIKFSTGENLAIGPNMLVQVKAPHSVEEPITVTFNSGSVGLKLAKKRKFKMANVVFEGDAGSEFKVHTSEDNKIAKVDVERGRVLAFDAATGVLKPFAPGLPFDNPRIPASIPSSESPDEKPNTKEKHVSNIPLTLDDGPSRIDMKISGAKIMPLGPLPGSKLASSKEVSFKWNSFPTAAVYVWEIARDREFANIVDSGETFETQANLEGLPTDEKLYWRVYAKDDDGIIIPEAEIWAFKVVGDYAKMKEAATAENRMVPVSDLPQIKSKRTPKRAPAKAAKTNSTDLDDIL